MKIYKGYYDSRNFSFEGYGKTRAEALATVHLALEIHTNNYNLEEGWFYPEEVFVTEYVIGLPYCDRDLITERN